MGDNWCLARINKEWNRLTENETDDLRGSIQGGMELQRGVGAVLQPNKADSMSKQSLIRGVLGQEGLFYIRIKDYLVINQGNTRKM